MTHTFASDNYAGVHPEILQALAEANVGHEIAYGEDRYTARLHEVMAGQFGDPVEVYPVFNGTGANVTALASMLPPWGAVICTSHAHIHTDEGAAPERVAGIKLLPVPAEDGKLTPELIDTEAFGWGFEHRAQPLVVSITQTTELGTVYTPAEILEIADHVHSKGMLLHLDGARIANAAAALGQPLRAFTRDVGVDVISFGGTKNGLMFGEAIVVLNPEAASGLKYVRKFNMQLASKMRFISAQLVALMDGDLWLRSATNANAMAARLRAGLEQAAADGRAPGLGFTQPTQANAIFATLPDGVAKRLQAQVRFYDWDEAKNEVRWMTSFDTTEADVDAFIDLICTELSA